MTWNGTAAPSLGWSGRGYRRRGMSAAAERPSTDELVAEPAHREEMLGLVRVPLDLLPNPLHVDVEGLRVADVVVPPDPLDQELACEQSSRRPQERLQQLELLRREGHRGATDEHLVAVDVHLDRSADENAVWTSGLREPRSSEVGADTGDQFADRERLGDVVVGAELEPRHLVGFGILGRDDDDRHGRLLPDYPHDVETGELRKHEIKDHELRVRVMEPLDRAAAV